MRKAPTNKKLKKKRKVNTPALLELQTIAKCRDIQLEDRFFSREILHLSVFGTVSITGGGMIVYAPGNYRCADVSSIYMVVWVGGR